MKPIRCSTQVADSQVGQPPHPTSGAVTGISAWPERKGELCPTSCKIAVSPNGASEHGPQAGAVPVPLPRAPVARPQRPKSTTTTSRMLGLLRPLGHSHQHGDRNNLAQIRSGGRPKEGAVKSEGVERESVSRRLGNNKRHTEVQYEPGASPLLHRLFAWRQKRCRQAKQTPNSLLPEHVIRALVERQPQSVWDLRQVPGVNRSKIMTSAQELLDIIRDCQHTACDLGKVCSEGGAATNGVLETGLHVSSTSAAESDHRKEPSEVCSENRFDSAETLGQFQSRPMGTFPVLQSSSASPQCFDSSFHVQPSSFTPPESPDNLRLPSVESNTEMTATIVESFFGSGLIVDGHSARGMEGPKNSLQQASHVRTSCVQDCEAYRRVQLCGDPSSSWEDCQNRVSANQDVLQPETSLSQTSHLVGVDVGSSPKDSCHLVSHPFEGHTHASPAPMLRSLRQEMLAHISQDAEKRESDDKQRQSKRQRQQAQDTVLKPGTNAGIKLHRIVTSPAQSISSGASEAFDVGCLFPQMPGVKAPNGAGAVTSRDSQGCSPTSASSPPPFDVSIFFTKSNTYQPSMKEHGRLDCGSGSVSATAADPEPQNVDMHNEPEAVNPIASAEFRKQQKTSHPPATEKSSPGGLNQKTTGPSGTATAVRSKRGEWTAEERKRASIRAKLRWQEKRRREGLIDDEGNPIPRRRKRARRIQGGKSKSDAEKIKRMWSDSFLGEEVSTNPSLKASLDKLLSSLLATDLQEDRVRTGAELARASPPALHSCNARQLRCFISEAGYVPPEGNDLPDRPPSAQLLAVARSALAAWEVRRVLACSHVGGSTSRARHLAVLRMDHSRCDADTVGAAFRKLSLMLHPDKHAGSQQPAADAFRLLTQARDALLGMAP